MRSLLFVPADSERKLAKGLDSGADVLLIDLEDSVALDAKDTSGMKIKIAVIPRSWPSMRRVLHP